MVPKAKNYDRNGGEKLMVGKTRQRQIFNGILYLDGNIEKWLRRSGHRNCFNFLDVFASSKVNEYGILKSPLDKERALAVKLPMKYELWPSI